MPEMTPLILAAVSGLLNSNRPLLTPASKTEWALLMFMGMCAAADMVFLALALYQYLTDMFTPSIAALISAAIFFAAALAAAVIRKLVMAGKAARQKPPEDEIKEKIHALMTSLFNELEEPIRDHPKTSVTVAALAGLLAARRM